MACKVNRFPKERYCHADFDRTISIIKNSQISDANYRPTSSIVNICENLPAIIADYTGRSQYVSGYLVQSEVTHKIIINYYSELEMLIKDCNQYKIKSDNGKIFNIESAINQNQDNLYIILHVILDVQ